MNKSKLIQNITSLNKKELKDFFKFTCSPYHNSNKRLIGLLEQLIAFYPDFKHKKLNKKEIFSNLYECPTPYNEGRFNLLMSQLITLLNDFFVFEEVKNNKVNYYKLNVQSSEKRKSLKGFGRDAQKLEAAIENLPTNGDYYLESFLLNKKRYHNLGSQMYLPNPPCFTNSLVQLDRFYLWEKMALQLFAKNRAKVLNEVHQLTLMEPLIQQMREEIEATPVLSIYKKIITLIDSEEDQLLMELVDDMPETLQKLTVEAQQVYMMSTINIATKKLREGNAIFNRPLLELYKKGLELGFFMENEIMQDIYYVNIATIASVCGAFEWAEEFMQKNEKYLVPKIADNAKYLSLAYFNYHQALQLKDRDKLKEVITILLKVKFTGTSYFYMTKSLLLRAYFEYYIDQKEGKEFILNHVNVFEQQLRRNKEKYGRKLKSYMSFTYFTKRLVKLRHTTSGRGEKLQILHENILAEKQVFAKFWMIEKIEEFKKLPNRRS